MHGLIFETSIWLLAGSTRFLRSIFPGSRQGKPKLNEFDSFWDCTQIRKNPNAENSTFIALFKQLRTNQRTQKEPKHSARNYSTKQKAFYHSLQIDAKLGILQKYKYKFSSTLQIRRPASWERCICQLAPILRKDWRTKMLNWNTFSMWRLTIEKNRK